MLYKILNTVLFIEVYIIMLSLIKGRAIGIIHGGKYDGEILGIDECEPKQEKKVCCSKCSEKCIKRRCCAGCQLCCCESDDEDSDEDIGEEFEIDDNGHIEQFPTLRSREVVYIAGPSGSGKSTYASKYIENYKSIHPDKPIYVFSRLPKDQAIDRLNPTRIVINEELIKYPIDISKELVGGCLVLFDDCDTINDDKLKKAVSKLKNDILETGRHNEIYIVNTSHLVNPNERKDARTIMNECHSLTVFPKSGSAHAIRYALQKYFGLGKEMIEDILNLPSRWVTIFKSYPQCVLYDKGAFLIK